MNVLVVVSLPFLRLRRLMCGKPLAFRRALIVQRGCALKDETGHSPDNQKAT